MSDGKILFIIGTITLGIIILISWVAQLPPENPTMKIDSEYNSERVSVNKIGVFQDNLAYDNVRGVYIITDKKTNKEYIGISGIGITETGSHSAGKIIIKDER